MNLNAWLKSWFEAYPALAGEDVLHVTGAEFYSWVPFWIYPFALALLALVAFRLYRREPSLSRGKWIFLSSLRTLAYWMIFFLLAAPEIRIDAEGVVPGVVPVILDATASMGVRDSDKTEEAGQRRIDQAWRLAELIRVPDEHAASLRLRRYAAGTGFRTVQAQADGSHGIVPDAPFTSLDAMLRNALDQVSAENSPAFILVSDGAENVPDANFSVLTELKRRGIRVYAIGVGAQKFRDVSIPGIRMENILFANEKTRAVIRILPNSCRGEKVKVRAWLEDQLFFEQEATLGADNVELEIPVEFTPAKRGVFAFRAEVEAIGGEAISDNNAFSRNFRVIDEHIRVLLAFGAPTWEYRYLVGSLTCDRRVKLSAYLAGADPRLLSGDRDGQEKMQFLRELPASAEDLNKDFDLVILSALDMTAVPETFPGALEKFVEEFGGGLAVSADPVFIPYTLRGSALESLIPVRIPFAAGRSYQEESHDPKTEMMRFSVTDEGSGNELLHFSGDSAENAKIWKNMPPIYRVYTGGRLKPSAVTLLATFRNERRQQFPALVLHSYGRGSVLFLAFDSTWRWRREFGNRFFREFWGKTVQYLGLPHLLREARRSAVSVDTENASAGEKIGVYARAFDIDYQPCERETLTLSVTPETGPAEAVELEKVKDRKGIYHGAYTPRTAGRLTFTLADEFAAAPVEVRVSGVGREWLNPARNDAMLKRIAEETGGAYLAGSDLPGLMARIADSRRRESLERTITLWDSWLLLAAALAVLAAEWIFRKLESLD